MAAQWNLARQNRACRMLFIRRAITPIIISFWGDRNRAIIDPARMCPVVRRQKRVEPPKGLYRTFRQFQNQ